MVRQQEKTENQNVKMFTLWFTLTFAIKNTSPIKFTANFKNYTTNKVEVVSVTTPNK